MSAPFKLPLFLNRLPFVNTKLRVDKLRRNCLEFALSSPNFIRYVIRGEIFVPSSFSATSVLYCGCYHQHSCPLSLQDIIRGMLQRFNSGGDTRTWFMTVQIFTIVKLSDRVRRKGEMERKRWRWKWHTDVLIRGNVMDCGTNSRLAMGNRRLMVRRTRHRGAGCWCVSLLNWTLVSAASSFMDIFHNTLFSQCQMPTEL